MNDWRITADNVEATQIITGQPCLDKEGCGSSDAMALYFKKNDKDESVASAHCFSCNKHFFEDGKEIKNIGVDTPDGVEAYMSTSKAVKKTAGVMLTAEQLSAVKGRTTLSGKGFRGIDDDTLDLYKIRTEYNDEGEVFKRYYPNTIEGKASSYQVRAVKEKVFFFMGKAGNETEFFGQRCFRDGGKRLLIVGGQEDCGAASQMLYNYRRKKGTTAYGRDAVVSTPSGENCVATVKKQYAWLDKFDEIIIGLDNDKAGLAAMDDMIPHMPKGKVRIAKWAVKDPNKMLIDGHETQFISNYFDAQKFVPIGILDTSTLGEKLRETIMLPKVGLPEFMRVLQVLMAGGIPQRKIINIAAETGIGKTAMVNEIVYQWMFTDGILPAVVTLELDAPEYAMSLLGRHVGKKLQLFEKAEDALKFVEQGWVKKAEHELYFRGDGSPRWYLVDDRATSVKAIQEKVEELIISFGCNVIVLDPISDLIARRPLDEQEDFMQWQKNLKKEHDVVFLNVNHVRGSSTAAEKSRDTVRFLVEDDMMGSTSIPKSADCNILLSRNKYAEDEMVRNTTEVWIPKCRWTGRTGSAGKWYYDNGTHKLHDLEDFVANNMQDGVKKIPS